MRLALMPCSTDDKSSRRSARVNWFSFQLKYTSTAQEPSTEKPYSVVGRAVTTDIKIIKHTGIRTTRQNFFRLASFSACRTQHANAFKAEAFRALLMASPLIGAQLLQVGNGLVDTLVAGRIGRVELGAVGLGSGLWFIVYISSIGLLAGLSPIMAKHIGRGETIRVGGLFRQGVWLALLLACLDFLILSAFSTYLSSWNFEPELAAATTRYLDTARWGIIPAVLLLPTRNVCEATGRTQPVLVVQLAGLLVNIFCDLGFGLGHFGLPAMGIAGIGWSTSIVMLCNCVLLYGLMTRRGFRRYRVYAKIDAPNWTELRTLLALSAPIALSILFEAGLFSATSVQIGQLGTLPMSAHNIAIGVAAFMYMLPLGLSFALTARIGVAAGKNSAPSIRLRAFNGIFLTLCMALCTSLLLLVFRYPIATLYTPDPAVRELAASLLILAAVFQFSDGMQVTLLAILRGLQDTRVPMYINAFSYWVIAFGLGYFANHTLGLGVYGLWLGLVVGLSLSTILLLWRLRAQLRSLSLHSAMPKT